MKVRYIVACQRHGKESKDWDGKQALVAKPKSKRDRFEGGCPECKAEAHALKNTKAPAIDAIH